MEEKRFRPYASSQIILIKDNQILLSKRQNTDYFNGYYSFVAGHIDEKETLKNAIIREAQEEIGIDLKEENLEIVHIGHRFNGIDRVYFDAYFKAKQWSGEIENKEPDKCSDLKWFNLNELPENIVPYIKLVLECVENNQFFSEFGFDK